MTDVNIYLISNTNIVTTLTYPDTTVLTTLDFTILGVSKREFIKEFGEDRLFLTLTSDLPRPGGIYSVIEAIEQHDNLMRQSAYNVHIPILNTFEPSPLSLTIPHASKRSNGKFEK